MQTHEEEAAAEVPHGNVNELSGAAERPLQTVGYEVARGLVDPTDLYEHMQMLISAGKGKRDPTVQGSLAFYKERRFEQLLEDLIPAVESRAGCPVYKTYSFARQYYDGQILGPHTDRPSCEISISLCLSNQGEPWPLWIVGKPGTPSQVKLNPGDAVFYKGIEAVHWRQKNIYGPTAQLFLHYVNQQGPFAKHRDDRNSSIGFSIPLINRTLSVSIHKRRFNATK